MGDLAVLDRDVVRLDVNGAANIQSGKDGAGFGDVNVPRSNV